jgi:NAD(P)-dependent dehydrogenase (short-subunit alcohol dehydrogenase family)
MVIDLAGIFPTSDHHVRIRTNMQIYWDRAFVARDAERVARTARRLAGSHGIVGDIARKDDAHRIALQVSAALGGLDVLVNNASSLGPVPLRPLADTDCEDLDAALATNLVGPFRLTKALLGALSASARNSRLPGQRAVVINIGSDAALTPYPGWGAYGTSKAALMQLSRIWDEELQPHGVRVLALDPGDMDTPLHALALPDADPATLKRPHDAALEILAAIDAARRGGAADSVGAARAGSNAHSGDAARLASDTDAGPAAPSSSNVDLRDPGRSAAAAAAIAARTALAR